jgi:hypothetical protein
LHPSPRDSHQGDTWNLDLRDPRIHLVWEIRACVLSENCSHILTEQKPHTLEDGFHALHAGRFHRKGRGWILDESRSPVDRKDGAHDFQPRGSWGFWKDESHDSKKGRA